MPLQKITPFLWFDGQAEAAMRLYTDVFPDSEIIKLEYWPEGDAFPNKGVQTGIMELSGLRVHCFDAGPMFKFNESVSFYVNCEDQAEIDYYWDRLIADGGQEGQCGWLKDPFGFSWQIVPKMLGEHLENGDPASIGKLVAAFMTMKKLDIAELERAYNQ